MKPKGQKKMLNYKVSVPEGTQSLCVVEVMWLCHQPPSYRDFWQLLYFVMQKVVFWSSALQVENDAEGLGGMWKYDTNCSWLSVSMWWVEAELCRSLKLPVSMVCDIRTHLKVNPRLRGSALLLKFEAGHCTDTEQSWSGLFVSSN